MVHIALCQGGLPFCQYSGSQCEFSTRREAFDKILKLEKRFHIKLQVIPGLCPYHEREGEEL